MQYTGIHRPLAGILLATLPLHITHVSHFKWLPTTVVYSHPSCASQQNHSDIEFNMFLPRPVKPALPNFVTCHWSWVAMSMRYYNSFESRTYAGLQCNSGDRLSVLNASELMHDSLQGVHGCL